jgi:hypothetical protein
MKRLFMFSLIMFMFNGVLLAEQYPRLSLEFESGQVWQSMNDVQIPNSSAGDRFSLSDLSGNGPWVAGRLYTTVHFTPKHSLRLLVAPLTIEEDAILSKTVRFAGGTFEPDPITVRYKFNSYRLTYRYLYYEQRWRLWIGFTAKIRDAVIKLSQQGDSAIKTDLGFVPLLHLAGEYPFNARSGFLFDLDALAGGPGRAEDLTFKLFYNPNQRWRIAAGYRTVEGGADVDEVYTFAWLHYAVLSVTCRY